jgi:tetratricopeptide (TPR) repeat protein
VVTLPGSFPAQAPSPVPKSGAAESHVGRGYELVKDQRYQEAAEEFRVALQLNPRLVRARYQLAVCLFALNQLDPSRNEFERLRKETGDSSNVIYYLGRLDLVQGNVDSAIKEFRTVAVSPPFQDTSYYLGSAYLKKGDLKEARDWLQNAAKSTPNDYRVHDHLARVYQRLGSQSEAEQEYAISSQIREQYDEAMQEAVSCSRELETQPLVEATTVCSKLFEGNDPDKLTTLGMIFGNHGYYKQALPPLEQAARLDPDSSEIQHDLGLTYFRLREYPQAHGPLEKAVELRPDFFGSNALLGATLYALEEDEQSYHRLSHAHELKPDDADTSALLFKVSLLLAQKAVVQQKYEQGKAFLDTAVQLRPTDTEVHRRLADVYELTGKPAEAAREKEVVERLSRANPQ